VPSEHARASGDALDGGKIVIERNEDDVADCSGTHADVTPDVEQYSLSAHHRSSHVHVSWSSADPSSAQVGKPNATDDA
jgi:hypothetical protein